MVRVGVPTMPADSRATFFTTALLVGVGAGGVVVVVVVGPGAGFGLVGVGFGCGVGVPSVGASANPATLLTVVPPAVSVSWSEVTQL